jgi:hypothetical protein
MSAQLTLSRHQLEQVITMLALNQNIQTIKFVEQSKSGIGPDVNVYFYNLGKVPQGTMDITDVDTW